MKRVSITAQAATNANVFCIKDSWEILRGRMSGNVGCRTLDSVRFEGDDMTSHYGVVIPDTEKNYRHLVGIFGADAVPRSPSDVTTITSLDYLRAEGKAIGKVSDVSAQDAREQDHMFIVELGSDDETFFVGNDSWNYCVLYDSALNEMKPKPQRPPLQAGDYVLGVSTDLDNISAYNYVVLDNGEDLVILNDDHDQVRIIDAILAGHFKRIDKE